MPDMTEKAVIALQQILLEKLYESQRNLKEDLGESVTISNLGFLYEHKIAEGKIAAVCKICDSFAANADRIINEHYTELQQSLEFALAGLNDKLTNLDKYPELIES